MPFQDQYGLFPPRSEGGIGRAQAAAHLDNPAVLNQILLGNLQRHFADTGQRETFARALALTLSNFLDSSFQRNLADAPALTSAMNRDGLARFGKVVDSDWIARARAYLESRPVHHGGARGSLAEARQAGWHFGDYDQDDLWSYTPFVVLANHPLIIQVVRDYFGVLPTLQFMASFWSFHGHDAPKGAQFYHDDYHGCGFVKFFVYLTDVDGDNGPHVFVRTSHRLTNWDERLRALEAQGDPLLPCLLESFRKRFRMRGRHHPSDAEVTALFGEENIVPITGAAGSGFLEDTAGLHKGALPIRTDRLVLQFVYTVYETFKDDRLRRPRPEVCDAVLAAHGDFYNEGQVRYINRLALAC